VSILTFPPYRLDPAEHRLWRGATAVELRPKTFAVLTYLAERPGKLVRNDELLDAVWKDAVVTPGTLNTSIRELRKALGDDARQPRYIETVHRRGFRFVAPVQLDTEAREGDGGVARRLEDLARAAATAADRGAHREAVAHARRAIELLPGVPGDVGRRLELGRQLAVVALPGPRVGALDRCLELCRRLEGAPGESAVRAGLDALPQAERDAVEQRYLSALAEHEGGASAPASAAQALGGLSRLGRALAGRQGGS
jgi:DNA-binding winged helix-turn-helix (wHTH) protein